MTAPIDFWFDYSSPYSYLLSERIDELAAQHGRTVRWRPILLGIVFRETGSAPLTQQFPAKAAYSRRDFARSARFLGLPYRHPDAFPVATQYAARVTLWLAANRPALTRPFGHACFRALFVDNRDISDLEVVTGLAGDLGVDRETVEAALRDPALKEELRTACSSALAAGVFGAPYVVIDGEPFFGADRLPQIERWLAEGSF